MVATSMKPVGRFRPPRMTPIRVRVDVEESAQPRYPLIQQLLPVHQDQRVRVSLGYQPAGDHGLAEGRCGCEHAGVVRHQGIRGCLLFRGERSEKARPKGVPLNRSSRSSARIPLAAEEVESSIETASR